MEIYEEEISVRSTQAHVFTIATHTMKYETQFAVLDKNYR